MTADEPSKSTDPSDETKRKFREALERKKNAAAKGESHLTGGSAIHGAHGPADHRRDFRRKSG